MNWVKQIGKSSIFRAIGLAVGIGIFYFAVSRFGGFKSLWQSLSLVGAGYLYVVLNSFIGILLFTKAWQQYFPSHQKISYFLLLRVRLCGEAANFMTPLGFAAGDPLRVLLLKKYLGPSTPLRSVVIDRVMHTLAAHLFCLLGLVFLLLMPASFPLGLSIFLLAFYVITSSIIAKLVFDLIGGKGLGFFEPIFKWLRLPIRFPKINDKISELRKDFAYYQDKPKGPIWFSFFLHFAGRLLSITEIMLILYFLNGQILFTFSFALAALTSFFGLAFAFIPGAFGILEAFCAHFFQLYGFSPEMGISIQIVRRLRRLFWIALGVLIFDFSEISGFIEQKRTNKSPWAAIFLRLRRKPRTSLR